jgi:alpha-L-fucosidase
MALMDHRTTDPANLSPQSLEGYGCLAAHEDRVDALSGQVSDADLLDLVALVENRLSFLRARRVRKRLASEPHLRQAFADMVRFSTDSEYEPVLLGERKDTVAAVGQRRRLPTLWDMRWRLVRAAVLACMLFGIGAVLYQQRLLRQRPVESPAAFATLQGTVRFQGGKEANFYSNCPFSAPSDGNGYFKLGGHTQVAVAKSSVFSVLSDRQIHLRKGAIWLDVEPGRQGFEVLTDHGWVRVTGTSFGVDAGTSRTMVQVSQGRVVVSEYADQAPVTAGHQLEVDSHGLGKPFPRPDNITKPGWVQAANAYGQALTGRSNLESRARELRDMEFGMFIHWSLSTFSGAKETVGIADPAYFAATGVDTDQWAQTAKEAGMRYVLFLVKHYDGFCLWDTKTTDFKVTNSPLGVDVLEELRKSCEKHGLQLALYLMARDASCPKGEESARLRAQVEELLTNYGPIAFIRFSKDQRGGGLPFDETMSLVRKWQPLCFTEAGLRQLDSLSTTNALPAAVVQNIAYENTQSSKEWNSPCLVKQADCPITTNGDGAWFDTGNGRHGKVLNASEISAVYNRTILQGGILALGLGPGRDGRLTDAEVEMLREVGKIVRKMRASHPARGH